MKNIRPWQPFCVHSCIPVSVLAEGTDFVTVLILLLVLVFTRPTTAEGMDGYLAIAADDALLVLVLSTMAAIAAKSSGVGDPSRDTVELVTEDEVVP